MLPANHLLAAHKGRISGQPSKGIWAHKKKEKKKALKVLGILSGGAAEVAERCANACCVRSARLIRRKAPDKMLSL